MMIQMTDKCFILGNGPSLGDIDLNLLKGQSTIGVNNIMKSGIVPNYLIISDTNTLDKYSDDILNEKEVIRSKNISHLWNAWQKYQTTFGSNMWALYNALTDWSTHIETKKSGSVASIRTRREAVVNKIISDPKLFQQKVAA